MVNTCATPRKIVKDSVRGISELNGIVATHMRLKANTNTVIAKGDIRHDLLYCAIRAAKLTCYTLDDWLVVEESSEYPEIFMMISAPP